MKLVLSTLFFNKETMIPDTIEAAARRVNRAAIKLAELKRELKTAQESLRLEQWKLQTAIHQADKKENR